MTTEMELIERLVERNNEVVELKNRVAFAIAMLKTPFYTTDEVREFLNATIADDENTQAKVKAFLLEIVDSNLE